MLQDLLLFGGAAFCLLLVSVPYFALDCFAHFLFYLLKPNLDTTISKFDWSKEIDSLSLTGYHRYDFRDCISYFCHPELLNIVKALV